MKNKILLTLCLLCYFITFSQDEFISTWRTTTNNETITIPVGEGTFNYTVDWGDGTIEFGLTGDATHTYSGADDYRIVITEQFPSIKFQESSTSRNNILEISAWGNNSWETFNSAFSYCENLQITATDAPNLTNVTDMSFMFNHATAFNSDINHWDVSNVTNMKGMLIFAANFNQPLDNWDVSKVTDMSLLFFNASSFNQFIENWDVSNVENMNLTFWGAENFNHKLNNWNVSNVNDMSNMFGFCKNFNQSLNNWDVGKVKSMRQMFISATNFNQSINSWNVSNVTDISFMFVSASNFNKSLGNWDVSNVTDMSYMFSGAENFNQPLDNWDVSNVTNMQGMFDQASNFNQPLDNWDVSNVTNMQEMFMDATSFNQQLGDWDVSSVTSMANMFSNVIDFGIASYDETLKGWSNLTLQQNVVLDVSSFFCNSTTERQKIIDDFNWVITDKGNDCDTLSLNDFFEDNISLYPNPVTDNFIVKLSNELSLEKVEIYSLSGKIIISSFEETINISQLSSGIYLTKVTTDKGVINSKIIKK